MSQNSEHTRPSLGQQELTYAIVDLAGYLIELEGMAQIDITGCLPEQVADGSVTQIPANGSYYSVYDTPLRDGAGEGKNIFEQGNKR